MEKLDVTEELVRLEANCTYFLEMLDADARPGQEAGVHLPGDRPRDQHARQQEPGCRHAAHRRPDEGRAGENQGAGPQRPLMSRTMAAADSATDPAPNCPGQGDGVLRSVGFGQDHPGPPLMADAVRCGVQCERDQPAAAGSGARRSRLPLPVHRIVPGPGSNPGDFLEWEEVYEGRFYGTLRAASMPSGEGRPARDVRRGCRRGHPPQGAPRRSTSGRCS